MVVKVLSLNKAIFFLVLIFISGCSTQGLVLVNKRNAEEPHIKLAVLDFYNHSTTSNPRLGRELAERLSYSIFAKSHGSVQIVHRSYIKSMLDKMGLKFDENFSRDDLILLSDSLEVDFIVRGTVIDYETDIMEKKNNVLEVLIDLVYSKDGSAVGMLKIRKKTKTSEALVEAIASEAGERIVREKSHLYSITRPPLPPDTSNAK